MLYDTKDKNATQQHVLNRRVSSDKFVLKIPPIENPKFVKRN